MLPKEIEMSARGMKCKALRAVPRTYKNVPFKTIVLAESGRNTLHSCCYRPTVIKKLLNNSVNMNYLRCIFLLG